ncbi:hypothetical protein VSX61_14885 [Brenneria populi subsp. brevivirga]|uniref:hypothetical protein n=1 Tax=Brenneria populi TaxID=1505588 RepID=UPI002E170CD3|nr:hypothetical protein [Brenneria populi subsp. brevivirga]
MAIFIRIWFQFATIYTCLTISDQISDLYFNYAQWPWIIGLLAAVIIGAVAIGKLNTLR